MTSGVLVVVVTVTVVVMSTVVVTVMTSREQLGSAEVNTEDVVLMVG